MIKYRTCWDTIEAIEILRETEKTVCFQFLGSGKEVRESKRSNFQNWHDTFEEAKEFLVYQAEYEVEKAMINLERAKGKLGQLRGMRQV